MAVKVMDPNIEFEQLASDERIEQTRHALEANGIHVRIAQNGEEARRMFFDLVPDGSEIFLSASVTLEQLGIKDVIDKSGRFNSLRPKIFAMDRATQGREIRKLSGTPDYAAGSVQAVTEDGHVMVVSKTGSQLGPYASGAGKVVWIVGAQKLVKDMDEGLRRIYRYSVPREQAHMQELYHTGTAPNKILIVNGERPGRITVVLVRQNLGF